MAIPIANLGVKAVNSGDVTVNHTLLAGSNRKVLAYVGLEDAASRTVTGITYGGVAMHLAVQASAVGAAANYATIWYLDEDELPADGVNAVAAALSGATSDRCILVRALSGIAQGAPYQARLIAETAPGDGTIENTMQPGVAVPQWAFSYATAGNTGSWAAGGTQVEYDEFNTASTCNQYADQAGGAGQTTLASTFTGTLNRLIRLSCVWTSFQASLMPDSLQFGSP